jgi:hypothetical protein
MALSFLVASFVIQSVRRNPSWENEQILTFSTGKHLSFSPPYNFPPCAIHQMLKQKQTDL